MGDHPQSYSERILIIQPWPEPKEILERLQKKFPDAEVVYKQISWAFLHHGKKPDIPEDLFQDATVLFTLGIYPSKPSSSPHLQLVHLSSAGADKAIEQPLFKETEIPFTTSSGIHGPQISEWFIMALLNSTHHYNTLYEQQKKQEWNSAPVRGVEDLVGQRLGVLGYGSIGRQSANIAKALGMDVIAYTASPRETPEKRKDGGFIVPGTGDPDGIIPSAWYSGTDKASLHKFLEQDIDVLLVAVPLTPATRHLLGAEEFSILSKKKTFVSNIARGPIIDSAALIKALGDGKLRGAALDVTDPEPLPPNDPLWTAPNTLITPHVSGNTTHYLDRSFQVLETNLEKKQKGQPLINVIDKRKGY